MQIDLIIDGVSFRRLPDHIEPRNSNLQASHTSNYRPGRSSSSSFNFSNGTYDSNSGPNSGANSGANSRENSFNPWECPRCTLVNSKPLAPVCEACGTSKPEHPKIVRKTPNTNATQMQNVNKPLPAQIEDLLGDNVHEQVDNSNGFGIFNPFGTEISNSTNSGFANFGSDPFGQSSFSAPPPVVYSSPPPQQQPQLQATYGRQVSHEEISNMLSGLDFSSPISSERVPQVVPQPKESETDSNSRTSSGDLWQSNMVDLNLKPQDRKKSTSIKSMQTLEQARVKAPLKEKTPVMPPPVPQNTFGTNMATLPSANGMMMYPQVSNQHIVTQGGFGASQFGTAQVPPSYISGQPQQFMTNIPPMGMHMGMGMAPGQKKSFVGVDPFATLS
jgi:hypothetical protein